MPSQPLAIRRIDFGYFLRPAEETGTGKPRVEALLGYAVMRHNGILLFDSGLGEGDAEADARYRPVRRRLDIALASAGIARQDVRWLANCHLHFDHCGGNPDFAGRPIFVQAIELALARTVTDYTLPHVVDFEGAHYEQLLGEAEIFPEVLAIPTPGHTEGHQVLAVRANDGSVVLAGQAHNNAFDYTTEQLAWRARGEGRVNETVISYRPWIERLQQLDPKRILFAHDYAVWEP
jgi:glyoxylase-like metal-dependent hydrolase (beta-lactamase superfamily II)